MCQHAFVAITLGEKLMRERRTNMRERCSRYSFILDISSLDVLTLTSTLRLSYCLERGHVLATSAWTFSRSYLTAPCMSGSETINHPLRDEPGLKTKKSMIIPDHQ